MKATPHDINRLHQLIKQWHLEWRHPELNRVLDKIDKGRLRPQQAKRWLRKIQPWVREQELRFNPFGPAPDQETLGQYDIEIGQVIGKSTRIGFNLEKPRHALITGQTGSGKSNLIRGLIDGIDAINRNRIHRSPGT